MPVLLVLTQQGPLKSGFKRKLSELIPQRIVLEEQGEADTMGKHSKKIGEHAVMREASRKQRETTGYYTPSLARGLAQGCE